MTSFTPIGINDDPTRRIKVRRVEGLKDDGYGTWKLMQPWSNKKRK